MKIGCVLVLYNPDIHVTINALKALMPQIDILVLVDNSLCINKEFQNMSSKGRCIYLHLGCNVGIAAAQNVGIEILKKEDIGYLLFMDQDSIAPSNMVESLVNSAYKIRKEASIPIGAIGPRAVNRQDSKEYKGSVKKGIKYNEELTEVTELISSGSLIPFENFDKVGCMDSSLFIDGVDHEWCWRARNKIGARFFILEKIKMSHQLGEGDHSFLWKKIAIPTYFRVYYQYRNYFLLIKRNYVPFYWKVSNGIKYIIKFFYFPLFIAPRKKYLINMLRGIYDGNIYGEK